MRPLVPTAILSLLLGPLLCLPIEARADDPKPAPVAPAPEAKAKTKPQKAAKKKPKRKREIKGPVASFPAFQMLTGGASRVSVEISEKVEVTEHKAQGRVTYRLKGASAPTRTNRLPLETMFFPSPLSRVQLVEQDESDLDLVIELSLPSTPTYKLVESEGGVLLQVDFPALPKGQTKPAPEVPQPPKPKKKDTKAQREASEAPNG